MKILIFYQYFGTPAGSWSTRVYEFTRRWVKAGHEVTVVTAPYEKSDIRPTGFISRMQIEGIKLIVVNSGDSNRDSFIKRALKALVFSFVSCKMAITEPCDVVIASSGPITVGIPALAAKWFRTKRMIFEIRDLWPQGAIELGKINNRWFQEIGLWFEKLCYKNSSLVVCCSPGMRDSVKSRFPEIETLVITNASDTEVFQNLASHEFDLPEYLRGEKYVVYAGSLGLMDHGLLMIHAMKFIKDPGTHLVIIGEGSEKKMLQANVDALQLKNIHFPGLLSKYEVASWLQGARAALVLFKDYPVLQTSSPNKLFDAFAAGIPVIHNTTGWIKELVDGEQCGVSVNPDDESGLAVAILKIITDNTYRNHLAKNSARLGQTLFNRDLLSQKYLDAICDL